MKEFNKELYWNEIPIGRQNAISYVELEALWGISERKVRDVLHQLTIYDNGDDYVLIRSSRGKGFYRTSEKEIIEKYKQECLRKGKSLFAPVAKINRILNKDTVQLEFENNLRVYREAKGLAQSEVCKQIKQRDVSFDKTMLSKMENNRCLPTPLQCKLLSEIYDCSPNELINTDFY